jgi:porin
MHQLTDTVGFRSKLEHFSYYGDNFANPIGGIRQGLGYDGRFGAVVDADLEKLAGWSGATFRAGILRIHGRCGRRQNQDLQYRPRAARTDL